jgi:hypothetical protein
MDTDLLMEERVDCFELDLEALQLDLAVEAMGCFEQDLELLPLDLSVEIEKPLQLEFDGGAPESSGSSVSTTGG